MELCVNHSLDEVAAVVERAMTLGSLGSGTVAYLLWNNRTARQPVPAAVLISAPATAAASGRACATGKKR